MPRFFKINNNVNWTLPDAIDQKGFFEATRTSNGNAPKTPFSKIKVSGIGASHLTFQIFNPNAQSRKALIDEFENSESSFSFSFDDGTKFYKDVATDNSASTHHVEFLFHLARAMDYIPVFFIHFENAFENLPSEFKSAFMKLCNSALSYKRSCDALMRNGMYEVLKDGKFNCNAYEGVTFLTYGFRDVEVLLENAKTCAKFNNIAAAIETAEKAFSFCQESSKQTEREKIAFEIANLIFNNSEIDISLFDIVKEYKTHRGNKSNNEKEQKKSSESSSAQIVPLEKKNDSGVQANTASKGDSKRASDITSPVKNVARVSRTDSNVLALDDDLEDETVKDTVSVIKKDPAATKAEAVEEDEKHRLERLKWAIYYARQAGKGREESEFRNRIVSEYVLKGHPWVHGEKFELSCSMNQFDFDALDDIIRLLDKIRHVNKKMAEIIKDPHRQRALETEQAKTLALEKEVVSLTHGNKHLQQQLATSAEELKQSEKEKEELRKNERKHADDLHRQESVAADLSKQLEKIRLQLEQERQEKNRFKEELETTRKAVAFVQQVDSTNANNENNASAAAADAKEGENAKPAETDTIEEESAKEDVNSTMDEAMPAAAQTAEENEEDEDVENEAEGDENVEVDKKVINEMGEVESDVENDASTIATNNATAAASIASTQAGPSPSLTMAFNTKLASANSPASGDSKKKASTSSKTVATLT